MKSQQPEVGHSARVGYRFLWLQIVLMLLVLHHETKSRLLTTNTYHNGPARIREIQLFHDVGMCAFGGHALHADIIFTLLHSFTSVNISEHVLVRRVLVLWQHTDGPVHQCLWESRKRIVIVQ